MTLCLFLQAYCAETREFEDPPVYSRNKGKGKVHVIYILIVI